VQVDIQTLCSKIEGGETVLVVVHFGAAGGVPLTARYHGGPYIDLAARGDKEGAFDVINVWDYAEGRPVIDFTPEAVAEAVRGWAAEYEATDLHTALAYF